MKKKDLNILIIAIILSACNSQPAEERVISEEDFFGETGEEVFEEHTIATNLVDVPEGMVNQFIHGRIAEYDTLEHNEFHMLDRFTFSERRKIAFKGREGVPNGDDITVTPVAEMFYYSFSDTTKTKNALYNWLDCFGKDCAQVKLFEEVEDLKTPPQFTLVYDTMIVVVDYRCEDVAFDWEPFQDSLINKFGNNYNYLLEVGCGGPLSWK